MDMDRLVLLELVKAGLWGKEARLSTFEKLNFTEILQLAIQQGVVGLVTAGTERVTDVRIPQTDLLQFVSQSLRIERRNKAMNLFVAELVEKMRAFDIYAILVKGQGVAQCYEEPLWRPSGDVDLLLSEANYKKAKKLLLPLSSNYKNEERYSHHLGMNIGQWYVEIHGSLRTGLSARVDHEVDAVQDSVFIGGNVRTWDNNGSSVFLPAPTEDVFLVFTHFIKHFYKEGMSFRQICDWCRLLYCYRENLNLRLLESWIKKSGLMIEWKAFATLAVEYLGMPVEAMPFINVLETSGTSEIAREDDNVDLNKKAAKLVELILGGYSGNKIKDTLQIAKIFPGKVLRYAPSIFLNVNRLKIRERVFGVKRNTK